ncbi:PMCA-type calcium-translocating P-type ATPase [Hesseltinella vesiculosa]|uniref:PMCA-type calcium-translocating P-type ATPase n=1 Tax=Hesseltinella vesiculosa TaxID=101127 RepID=A0A1X2GX49_9FUNG|nr:PMCA-type calcium-translocating P-type ATPase [Hesseltinella vesiculosa]
MTSTLIEKTKSPFFALTKQDHPILHPPPALYFDRDLVTLHAMYPATHPDHGLAAAKVLRLQQHYGLNQLPPASLPSAWRVLFHQFTDLMVILLLIASIVEGAQGDFHSMSVLLSVIGINTIIGFTQEWKASKTLHTLMDVSIPQARVIRDGQRQIVSAHELVPGDLVVVEEGDVIPADMRLLSANQLEVVESVLTGESLPVQKNAQPILSSAPRIPIGDCFCNVFMSTMVIRGRAVGLVTRTGLDTEIGKINAALSKRSKAKTRIQMKLDKLGRCLVGLAALLCAFVVFIGLAWQKNIHDMLNVGLSLAVSVIPEGLVAVTTVTMALAVRHMAKRHCLLRTLPAIETLGSVTMICSDKTGTLTEGRMSAAMLWTGDGIGFDINDINPGYPMAGTLKKRHIQDKDNTLSFTLAMMVCALCHHAQLDANKNASSEPEDLVDPNSLPWHGTGDPLELALLAVAEHTGYGPATWPMTLFWERPFDRDRKMMSMVYKKNKCGPTAMPLAEEDSIMMVCKGAPEAILSRCAYIYGPDGTMGPITKKVGDTATQEHQKMAAKGLRVIGLAIKQFPALDSTRSHLLSASSPATTEAGLVFVGFIAVCDPPKLGIEAAIATCQQAGIQVIMMTGDHPTTATAIARQIGILQDLDNSQSLVVHGQEVDLMSSEKIQGLEPFPRVFARVSPDHKLKIVEALQQRGEVVAMTGDGVNDAMAIKQADIGIAMGSGTETTKLVADMILLNNDFATLVDAIEEGRHVFDNILKFVVYLLSCNGAEIFLMLICAIANLDLPLTVMMILWANIIADIPPAMAIGVEKKEKGLMQRLPRDPHRAILTKVAWAVIGTQALFMAGLTILTYCLALYVRHMTLAQAQSLAFTTLTTVQLLHSFLSKSIHQSIFSINVFDNVWLIVAFIISFGLMVIGIYVPGISSWLELTNVDGLSWAMICACCLAQILFVEAGKWFIRTCHGQL